MIPHRGRLDILADLHMSNWQLNDALRVLHFMWRPAIMARRIGLSDFDG